MKWTQKQQEARLRQPSKVCTLTPHTPFPFQKGSTLVSKEWKRSTALWSTKQLLSQYLRQCRRQWLLEGSGNKHSHGTAKIHRHLATKMSDLHLGTFSQAT